MIPNNNFNASEYINTIDSNYNMIEDYFNRDQLELMDSIDSLYNTLNVDSVVIPLTVMQMMEV